jgi:hypothetical protein
MLYSNLLLVASPVLSLGKFVCEIDFVDSTVVAYSTTGIEVTETEFDSMITKSIQSTRLFQEYSVLTEVARTKPSSVMS